MTLLQIATAILAGVLLGVTAPAHAAPAARFNPMQDPPHEQTVSPTAPAAPTSSLLTPNSYPWTCHTLDAGAWGYCSRGDGDPLLPPRQFLPAVHPAPASFAQLSSPPAG